MRRRWIAWSSAALAGLLLVAATSLLVLNDTLSRDPFTAFTIVIMVSYIAVGAILSTRLPRNPIGWLLLAVGLGILVSGFAAEYATYTLITSPGALPFARAAAWLQSWGFIVVGAIPLILLLFPTGRVPSPGWRWLPYALVIDAALMALATMVRPGAIDVTTTVQPDNPLGIQALRVTTSVVLWTMGILLALLSLAAIVALVQRFGRSAGDERQQLRWLAAVGALCGVSLVLTLLTSIGVPEGGSRPINDLMFLFFFVSLGIGIPSAIAVSLLRYRLYDLDIVLKKAAVATILVLFLGLASLVILLAVGGLVVGPLTDSPGATLVAGFGLGVLTWPTLRLSRRIADRLVYGGRATPYDVLTDFSTRMADVYSTEDVLPRMAAIVAAGTRAERATIWLLVGGELRPAATWPGGSSEEPAPPVALQELTGDAFVVRHQGEQLGAITVTMRANDPMNPSKERLIRDLAGQAGLVLRNVRLIEELRASRRRLVAAQDNERRRLERDIHDGAQQQLVALAVRIRLADQLLERDPSKAHELLAQLQSQTADALEDLRDLARGIYPPLLADEGLPPALEAQARKSALPVTLHPDGVGRYAQEIEATVYFCVLEAMQNIAKYAKANAVTIDLREDAGHLAFDVQDDGVGFDPAAAARGTGLQGMADRLDAIGGELQIHSAPGHGTTVSGIVPLTVGVARSAPEPARSSSGGS